MFRGFEWREIPYSSSFEIDRYGTIRNARTGKIRTSQAPISYTGGDGKVRTKPIWEVMTEIWPEIMP